MILFEPDYLVFYSLEESLQFTVLLLYPRIKL